MANTFKYTADTLKFMFEEYKEDMQNYYYLRPELIKGGDYAGQVVNVKIPKPYSVVSFCAFAVFPSSASLNPSANFGTAKPQSNAQHSNLSGSSLIIV